MRVRAFALIALLAALAAAAIVTSAPRRHRPDEILVSAAASLSDALSEIGQAYTRQNPRATVRINFGASGALEQQIMQGAPVDVFASASPDEMDALQRARRIEPATRVDFAGNDLVLIAPAYSTLRGWGDLRSAAVRHVAISDPAFVPSGRYARQSLTRHGLWGAVQPKVVLGNNVRQTLTYVANGDADAGLVFATDAFSERGRVRAVARTVAGEDHRPIVYPAAVVAHAANAPEARRFVAFLRSATAQNILRRHGFARPELAPSADPVHADRGRLRSG